MPETTSASAPLPLEKAAPVLAMHVERVRRRMGLVALGSGLLMMAPALLVWLAVTMPLDWHLELAKAVRALLFAAGAGGAGAIAWWYGIRRWAHRPGEDAVALAIERALPELRSRFIASIQLTRRPEDHTRPLVRALVKETTERTRDLEFDRVVSTAPLTRWLKIGAACAIIGAGLWWLGGTASWPLFQRALLLNVPKPSNTQIVSFTGDRVLAIGDDLRIEARTAGIIPAVGKLRLKSGKGAVQEFTLDPDPAERSHFLRTLQAVQSGFQYRLEIGDTRTEWSTVQVRHRPTVQELNLEQHWPAYTGIPPQKRTPNDLKLLAGSRLHAAIRTNVPLRSATLRLLKDPRTSLQDFALTPAGLPPPVEWKGEARIPAGDVTAMTFQLADEVGVASSGLAAYRVEVIPDRPPTLAILWPPRREELVTARATLLIAFEAKDDFGLGRVRLHYATNWAEGAPHRSLDLDIGTGSPKQLTRRFEWDLGRVSPPLKEGDVVDFWFEALDRNDVTGPGRTILAEHYQARVVSDEEKRADLAARLTDTLQGLNEVRTGQEDLARSLGELIYAKPPGN